jgi:hypothetical protein
MVNKSLLEFATRREMPKRGHFIVFVAGLAVGRPPKLAAS